MNNDFMHILKRDGTFLQSLFEKKKIKIFRNLTQILP